MMDLNTSRTEATFGIARRMADIEKSSEGGFDIWWWNTRQRDMMAALYNRTVRGGDLIKVSRFERIWAEQHDVTERTIRDDVDALIERGGWLERAPAPNSRRDKIVVLTPEGRTKYEAYADSVLEAMRETVAAADAVAERDAGTPQSDDPNQQSNSWGGVMNGIRSSAASLFVALTLAFGIAAIANPALADRKGALEETGLHSK